MTSDSSRTAATALAVAAGGAVGAALRYQLWRWWPDNMAEFPLTTFAINVVGCFVFGVCVGSMPDTKHRGISFIRTFVIFGFLSGFTTFSFYAVQGIALTSPKLGLLYLIATPTFALTAAWAGRATALARSDRAHTTGRNSR